MFGWLGEKLLQLEREKGIVIRFMIGHRFFTLCYCNIVYWLGLELVLLISVLIGHNGQFGSL